MFVNNINANRRNEILQNRRKQKVLTNFNSKYGIHYSSIVEKIIDQNIDLFDQNLTYQQIEDQISKILNEYLEKINIQRTFSKEFQDQINSNQNQQKVNQSQNEVKHPQTNFNSNLRSISLDQIDESPKKNQQINKDQQLSANQFYSPSKRNQESTQKQLSSIRNSMEIQPNSHRKSPTLQNFNMIISPKNEVNIKKDIETQNQLFSRQNANQSAYRYQQYEEINPLSNKQSRNSQNPNNYQEINKMYNDSEIGNKSRMAVTQSLGSLNQKQPQINNLRLERLQSPDNYVQNYQSHMDTQEIKRREYLKQFNKMQEQCFGKTRNLSQINENGSNYKLSRVKQKLQQQIQPDNFYLQNEERQWKLKDQYEKDKNYLIKQKFIKDLNNQIEEQNEQKIKKQIEQFQEFERLKSLDQNDNFQIKQKHGQDKMQKIQQQKQLLDQQMKFQQQYTNEMLDAIKQNEQNSQKYIGKSYIPGLDTELRPIQITYNDVLQKGPNQQICTPLLRSQVWNTAKSLHKSSNRHQRNNSNL